MRQFSLALAQTLMKQGMEKALADYSRPICIAACDAEGNLLAFSRMDDAPLRSIAISIHKAYTACHMGVHTEAFYARLQRENLVAADFCDPLFTALPGGAVIRDKAGAVLGGIGISGLKAEEDQVIASALAGICEQKLNG